MNERKDFDLLLADEDFQNGIIDFDDFSEKNKKAFIRKYSINKSEYVKARNLITGLSYKGVEFSDDELNYLWKSLGIDKSGNSPYIISDRRKLINLISKVAAILFIPLLLSSLWFFQKTNELQLFKEENIKRLFATYNTVYSPLGGKTKAVLPDGSEVWLNSGSSIQYPLLSKDDYREVKLSGEGFFQVVKNPGKPMLVTTSGMQIKVYGTTFNVNAYDDQSVIETALVEGKISIMKLDENGKSIDTEIKMKPGELGRIFKDNNKIEIAEANNMDVYTGWVSGKYIFKNLPLYEILKRLEHIHNVEFDLEDKELGEYNFDATFTNQNIEGIMDIFALSLPLTWKEINTAIGSNPEDLKKRIIISKVNSKSMH